MSHWLAEHISCLLWTIHCHFAACLCKWSSNCPPHWNKGFPSDSTSLYLTRSDTLWRILRREDGSLHSSGAAPSFPTRDKRLRNSLGPHHLQQPIRITNYDVQSCWTFIMDHLGNSQVLKYKSSVKCITYGDKIINYLEMNLLRFKIHHNKASFYFKLTGHWNYVHIWITIICGTISIYEFVS